MGCILCGVHGELKSIDVCQECEVQEHHRRDGFEVGNADNPIESTGAAPSRKTQQPMVAHGKDTKWRAKVDNSSLLKATGHDRVNKKLGLLKLQA